MNWLLTYFSAATDTTLKGLNIVMLVSRPSSLWRALPPFKLTYCHDLFISMIWSNQDQINIAIIFPMKKKEQIQTWRVSQGRTRRKIKQKTAKTIPNINKGGFISLFIAASSFRNLGQSSHFLGLQRLSRIADLWICNSFNWTVRRKSGSDFSLGQPIIDKEWRSGIILGTKQLSFSSSSLVPPITIHSFQLPKFSNMRYFNFGNMLFWDSLPKNSSPTFSNFFAPLINNDSRTCSFPKGGKNSRL